MNTTNVPAGTLCITDAQLIIRPRTSEPEFSQYAKHDEAYAYEILSLGNNKIAHRIIILTALEPKEAKELLQTVFSCYVRKECANGPWCSATVDFIVSDKIVVTERYGFYDGCYEIHIEVYCSIDQSWVKSFVPDLAKDSQRSQENAFIIVRPEPRSKLGYSISVRRP